MTAVGPVTVRVSEGRAAAGGEGGQPSVSGTYRHQAAMDGLLDSCNGCATLYELFNKAVQEHGGNRWVLAANGRWWWEGQSGWGTGAAAGQAGGCARAEPPRAPTRPACLEIAPRCAACPQVPGLAADWRGRLGGTL